jgi:hypothetical protein
VPQLGAQEEDVPVATRFVPDARATHYWDGTGGTMRSYRATLALPEDAWDVYMVYGPDARWDSELPPKPVYWMHQLGSADEPRVKGPYLDPAVFAAKVTTLLEGRGMGQ